MQKDLERSKACGFSAHLTKPVKVDALDAALAKVTTSVEGLKR